MKESLWVHFMFYLCTIILVMIYTYPRDSEIYDFEYNEIAQIYKNIEDNGKNTRNDLVVKSQISEAFSDGKIRRSEYIKIKESAASEDIPNNWSYLRGKSLDYILPKERR